MEWYRLLYRHGWLGLSWPVEYGGRGLGPIEEAILNEEVGSAGGPPLPASGYIGRPILHHGSEEQKRQWLPPMLSFEEQWCQSFSEPGAGSDLAGISTRAVLEEGFYRLSGQKIWTSYGQFARFALVLTRTEPDSQRHHGLSLLVVDLTSPGVEVRPIITAEGAAEFCEVFYDDVAVPAGNLVGEAGQGWAYAMTTLAYERGPVDIGFQARYQSMLKDLAAQLTDEDPVTAEAIGRAAIAVEVLRMRSLQTLTRRADGALPGSEGSVDKLLMASTEQLLMRTALDLLGSRAFTDADSLWFRRYLYSRAATVYGGTAEIQKHIIAERVLHLPRSKPAR